MKNSSTGAALCDGVLRSEQGARNSATRGAADVMAPATTPAPVDLFPAALNVEPEATLADFDAK